LLQPLSLASRSETGTISTFQDFTHGRFEHKEQARMASKSSFEKMKRNEKLIAKYAKLRKELKEKGDWVALAKLPRNSSPTRLRRICALTGRPRGNYRKFRVCRIMLRDLALDGLIPGLRKASW
jgi:small subunit ribosomal protein S14